MPIFNLLFVMTTLTLQVPDSLEENHDDTVRFLAAKLYESGKLSLGQAAEMVGMKKWDFAEILIAYGVNYLDPSVTADLENARKSS
jgi:predicted HTH domain antitoxin